MAVFVAVLIACNIRFLMIRNVLRKQNKREYMRRQKHKRKTERNVGSRKRHGR
jgi:ABC-type Fe3+ transport system permease subunit